MIYDFDEIVPRERTNCVKYDGRKGIFGTADVIPMWVADMDFRAPDFIVKALKKRADHEIYGYTFQSDRFYDSVINWAWKRHGWKIRREWMLFTPGVVPALALSVMSIAKPGDKVVIQPPVYTPFFTAISPLDRRISSNALVLKEGGYLMDLDDLEKKFRGGARLLLFSNPHNPVGRVWKRKELVDLGNLCAKYGVTVMSDEIHSDLVYKPNRHLPLASVSKKFRDFVVTAISPSKTFNIAGLSSSVVIIPNPEIREKFSRMSHAMHLHMGNLFGLTAFEAAYTHGAPWLDQLLKYLAGNLRFVIEYLGLNVPSVRVIVPEGTYLVWLDFRQLGLPEKALCNLLVRKGKVGLSDGAIYGREGKGFMRLNIACPRAVLKKAMAGIMAAVSDI